MNDELKDRARSLRLYGLLSNWDEFAQEPWLPRLIEIEEIERHRRSLERRISGAHIGPFKPMSDFDWSWPKKISRKLIEELFTFRFIGEGANAIFIGTNGVGKTMIVKNIAHQALLKGHTVRFTTASEMLNDLAAQEGAIGLNGRLKFYCRPSLLAIDEIGYLSYDSRHADLLFEIISRRYCRKSIVVTTNKPFAEWNQVFPNASSVVALIDRLVHKAEIIQIEAESYRLKEAKERNNQKKKSTKK